MKKNKLIIIVLSIALLITFYFLSISVYPDNKADKTKASLDSIKFSNLELSNWPYTSFQDWALELKKVDPDYQLICEESDLLDSSALKRSLKINDRLYCVKSQSEGALGSVFTSYSYITLIDDLLIKLETTLRQVNCNNYDEPVQGDCLAEREAFEIDEIIDSLIEVNFLN